MKNNIRFLGIDLIDRIIQIEINRSNIGSRFYEPKVCSRLRIERYINNHSHQIMLYKMFIRITKEDF